jgi:hypothetical protein
MNHHPPTLQNIPILLTSSVIAHDPGVALKNTEARVRYALESVREWLRICPELQLVLCDGSGFDFTGLMAQHFPQAKVECLYFMNDQAMVLQRGRGWGEGEIVRHAIENSLTIRHAGAFAKCTSKLWVSNYLELLEVWNGSLLLKGVFLHVFSAVQKPVFDYIDTRFYVVSVATYTQLFVDAHLSIDQHRGHGLEQCFFEIVQKQQLQGILTARPPVIEGVGGGIGRAYQNPLKRRLKERLRSWLVRRNPAFYALFIAD